MNNKIISQEQISTRLKVLEIRQRVLKAFRDNNFKLGNAISAKQCQIEITKNKYEINLLLSVVFWQKKAKKIFYKNKKKA